MNYDQTFIITESDGSKSRYICVIHISGVEPSRNSQFGVN